MTTENIGELGAAPSDENSGIAPVSLDQRSQSLDALRGFALLGILTMNIMGFALPGMAFFFPSAGGGTEGANQTAWYMTNLLTEGSMRTLFSMMFGAGVILLTSRMFERGQGERAADIYYRRNIWLLVLGLIDGYLFLWWGDILFGYALVGLFLYPMRNISAKKLIIIASILLALITIPRGVGMLVGGGEFLQTGREAIAIEEAGGELTPEQENVLKQFKPLNEMLNPTQEALDKQITAMRGSYGEAFAFASKETFKYQWKNAFPGIFVDVLMMMLFGMALLKKGVLTLESKTRTYVLFILIGYGFGFLLRNYSAAQMIAHNFQAEGMMYMFALGDISRLALAFGHIGLIMLMMRSGFFGWVMEALSAVGRMALTNYLMQSIICAYIFYGFGMGLYGTLERSELYPIMFKICAFQIVFSYVWLRFFRFGPFEWVWRSLTYYKRQPMLK